MKCKLNRNVWYLSPLLLEILWFLLIVESVVFFGSLTVYLLGFGEEFTNSQNLAETLIVCSVSGVGFLLTLFIWRRSLYLKNDVVSFLKSMDAAKVFDRNSICVFRIDGVFIAIEFDHPFYDFWPHPTVKKIEKRKNINDVILEGGYNPRYMQNISLIKLFVPHEFSRCIKSNSIAVINKKSIDSYEELGCLESMISNFRKSLNESDIDFDLILASKWLCIQTTGGSWLGNKFEKRIRGSVDLILRINENIKYRDSKPIQNGQKNIDAIIDEVISH